MPININEIQLNNKHGSNNLRKDLFMVSASFAIIFLALIWFCAWITSPDRYRVDQKNSIANCDENIKFSHADDTSTPEIKITPKESMNLPKNNGHIFAPEGVIAYNSLLPQSTEPPIVNNHTEPEGNRISSENTNMAPPSLDGANTQEIVKIKCPSSTSGYAYTNNVSNAKYFLN